MYIRLLAPFRLLALPSTPGPITQMSYFPHQDDASGELLFTLQVHFTAFVYIVKLEQGTVKEDIMPAIWACAMAENQTGDQVGHGTKLNHSSHISQGCTVLSI